MLHMHLHDSVDSIGIYCIQQATVLLHRYLSRLAHMQLSTWCHGSVHTPLFAEVPPLTSHAQPTQARLPLACTRPACHANPYHRRTNAQHSSSTTHISQIVCSAPRPATTLDHPLPWSLAPALHTCSGSHSLLPSLQHCTTPTSTPPPQPPQPPPSSRTSPPSLTPASPAGSPRSPSARSIRPFHQDAPPQPQQEASRGSQNSSSPPRDEYYSAHSSTPKSPRSPSSKSGSASSPKSSSPKIAPLVFSNVAPTPKRIPSFYDRL
jgi:hypothetical protein